MFLSAQQKFILDALGKLNCVRRRQLHALVRGQFETDSFSVTQARMDAMLRQLRMGMADVRVDDELVWLSKNLYSQPQTPSGRAFFRHTALRFLEIHKVFPRKRALSDGKIPRPDGILGCEYRF